MVGGETRVVPVKAEIDNPLSVLKPGMFAELEVLTGETALSILAISNAAVVDANGKKLVYVQNGNAYQSIEVGLGQTSGDMVEVKTGLFTGDLVVTQRATQLYAQSLRGGSKVKEEHSHAEEKKAKTNNKSLPLWLLAAGGGIIATGAFAAGSFWSNRKRSRLVRVGNMDDNEGLNYQTEVHLDDCEQPSLSSTSVEVKRHDSSWQND